MPLFFSSTRVSPKPMTRSSKTPIGLSLRANLFSFLNPYTLLKGELSSIAWSRLLRAHNLIIKNICYCVTTCLLSYQSQKGEQPTTVCSRSVDEFARSLWVATFCSECGGVVPKSTPPTSPAAVSWIPSLRDLLLAVKPMAVPGNEASAEKVMKGMRSLLISGAKGQVASEANARQERLRTFAGVTSPTLLPG